MNNKTKTPEKLDSVDQIRNILFGEQISLIEHRFLKLEESLTKSIDVLSKKVEKDFKNLIVQVEKSNKTLQKDNSSQAQQQSDEIKSLETNINKKIIETESDLLNQFQASLQILDQKASHRKEMAQLLKEMADKLAD